jgi:NAD(P)-dependent dehydrogenase (short-subunit alcohol dehydrogenase family)
MSVWFVTGASRGLGAEIVQAALAAGHRVIATTRDAEAVRKRFSSSGDQLLALTLNVTDERQARAAAAAGVERFGRIDVLVNNAGRGLLGAVEEASDAEVRAVYETNVFGLLAVTRAVAPVLRSQRSGHIVNLSSVGGFVGSPGWGIYASTKFAVEGLSESLAAELAPLGVGLTIVEPGYFRTDFLDSTSLHTTADVIEDYSDGPAGAMRATAQAVNHGQPGDPAKAAAVIVEVITAGDPPTRLPLGADCVAAMERKLALVATQLEATRHFALSTDHG